MVKAMPTAAVEAEMELPLHIVLDADWVWNGRGPSWLALFSWPEKRLLKSWERMEWEADRARFPKLQKDKEYRLQGTFYYCHDTHGRTSVRRCVVQSMDRTVSAREGAARELLVRLQAEP